VESDILQSGILQSGSASRTGRPTLTDARLAQLWSLLDSDLADGLCLDVFDTLLFRTVPEPAQAFLVLGTRLEQQKRLPVGVTPEVFAQLRVEAERRARERSLAIRGTAETRLAEIYDVLRIALPLAGHAEDLQRLEVEVERDVCRADLGLVELVEAVVGRLGKPVYLVSDTYFSAAHLERLLDRPELPPGLLAGIFTSSDHAISKSDGLFDVVLGATGARPSRLVHLGDHPVADLKGAREAGLQAIHYPKLAEHLGRVAREEGLTPARLDSTAPVDPRDGDFGLTALRARVMHRSDAAVVPEGLRRYWEAGATVFGPAMAGFAEWVAERARAFGVDRIYCLLREGDFLSDLVRDHAAAYGIEVQTLWASRQVCALASVYEGTPQELSAFLTRRRAPTVGQLAQQLGVSLAEVPALADLADRRLDIPGVADAALSAISAEPAVRGAIVVRAARLRERLLRYLDGQLPTSGIALVVDLGWGGTIQTLLSRVLRSTGRDLHLIGLYLATNNTALQRRLDGFEMEGYLASSGEPARPFAPVMRSPEILEQLCMPDFGSLVGFDERLDPITSPARMSRTQAAQKAAAQAGVRAFHREWIRYRRSENPLPSLSAPTARLQLLDMLSRFVARPTEEEALAFSSWVHDENFGSDAVEGIVTDDMLRLLPYLTPADLDQLSMQELYWPAGVAAVVNPPLARLSALVQQAGADPDAASPYAGAGSVEVYVDQGGDFVAGPKETVQPRVGRDGLSWARLRIGAEGVRRIRIDPSGRRGIVRVDWVRYTFHLLNRTDPVVLEVTDLHTDPHVGVTGARFLQPNLLDVDTDDPQIIYTLDPGQGPMAAVTYAVDVEMAFVWMAVRSAPLEVPVAAAPAASLGRRAVRKAVRMVASRV
jgi:FMN phosphatase YigB (HAD superfamily)